MQPPLLALTWPTGPILPVTAQQTVVLSGTVTDDLSGVAQVTVRLASAAGTPIQETSQLAALSGDRWHVAYPVPVGTNGRYRVLLTAADGVGNVANLEAATIVIDDEAPLAEITSTGVSTQTMSGLGANLPVIAGTVTDPPADPALPASAVGVKSLEIGLVPFELRENPESIDWQPVPLDRSGPITATWTYTVPAGLEGSHQIALRSVDNFDRARVQTNVWGGEIDTLAPRVLVDQADLPQRQGAVFTRHHGPQSGRR